MLNSLLMTIYDTPLQPGEWDGLTKKLADFFEAEKCSVVHLDVKAGSSVIIGRTASKEDEWAQAYQRYYHTLDLWSQAGRIRNIVGRAVTGQELVPDREILRSEFYNDWGRHSGSFNILGGRVPSGDGAYRTISMHRSYGTEAYGRSDTRKLDILLPHLERSAQIEQRLSMAQLGRNLALEALNNLSIGMMLVAVDGQIRFCNAVAEKFLSGSHGLGLRHGRLRAKNERANALLQWAIEGCCRTSAGKSSVSGGPLFLPAGETRRLSLLVTPAPSPLSYGKPEPLAAIFIGQPGGDRHRVAQAALADIYSLTRAEAALAAALLSGDSLAEYAERSGVSIHTVRTQMKHILAKSGFGGQADLIRDVLSDPILRMFAEKI